MNRAAQLAKEAETCLRFEREWIGAGGKLATLARVITRDTLEGIARELGFQENEISAAVDEALTAAGTTP